MRLCSYTGEVIPVLASVDVSVKYKGQAAQLPLMIVKGDSPSLLRRNWLDLIQLDWREIHYLQSNLQSVMDKHKPLFQTCSRLVNGPSSLVQASEDGHALAMD